MCIRDRAEAVAETDEELMMRYFENEGEDFTEAEIVKGLHDGIHTVSYTHLSRAVCTGCPKRYFYIFQPSDVLGSLV